MVISIQPKYAVSQVVGFVRGNRATEALWFHLPHPDMLNMHRELRGQGACLSGS
jgi:hypothetical protein